MKQPPPCPGSGQEVDAGQFGRVACPECGRIIAVRRYSSTETTGTLYRHQKALGRSSRLWRERARADEVRRNEWRHYHNNDLVVRLWFTHFGGEEAFEEFSKSLRTFPEVELDPALPPDIVEIRSADGTVLRRIQL